MTISLNKLLWLCGASFVLSAGTLVLAVLRGGDVRKPQPLPQEDGSSVLREAERARVQIAAKVGRSMVRVTTTRQRPVMRTVRGPSGERQEPAMVDARPLVGAGFLISVGGRVATNAHVVKPLELSEGEILNISVTLEGESTPRKARLIGTDDVADLAILQVVERKEGESFVPLEFAESRTLQPGRDATAFGYPFQLPLCSTAGRVSNAAWHHGSHPIPFILLDAKINPGNSGGPVVDLDGKVMGVITRVTASAQTPGGGAFGMAIPAHHVREVLDLLESEKRRGWLGMIATEKLENGARVLVAGAVAENSPAARAGLRRGDAILSILGHKVLSYGEYRQHQLSITPGQKVPLSILRGGKVQELTIDAVATPALPPPDSKLIPALGLRVRDHRPDEKQRLGIEEGVPAGVVLTAVDPESRFQELQAGDRILLVKDPDGNITQLADAADLRDRVALLRDRGGQIYVDVGDEAHWLPFLPAN